MCLLPRWCSGRRVVCCRAGLLVVPVGGGPPASRPRCELRSARRLEARPGPLVPSGPSGALHTSGAGCADVWLDASQAPPPSTGTAARPRSCGLPMALRDRQRARLKPPSPLLVRACVGLKLPSPLRARNERFWCSFRVQRCRWFQWLRFGGEHWCCGFQSPASECTVRDFFRPARPRVRASAKKFSQHAPKSQKSVFYGVLGEFFRGNADGGGVLGCNSGAGSRRIPPRIASPYHERPASHADAPRPR